MRATHGSPEGGIMEFAAQPRTQHLVSWLSANAMPLFLWHTVGFAGSYAFMRAVASVPEEPSLMWWITRPLWLIGPALLTFPLLKLTRGMRRAM
jgi:hypothetical protein